MAEISAGSLAPPQAAVAPPVNQVTPRALDATACEERAVRGTEPSPEANIRAEEERERRRAEAEQAAEHAAAEARSQAAALADRPDRIDVPI